VPLSGSSARTNQPCFTGCIAGSLLKKRAERIYEYREIHLAQKTVFNCRSSHQRGFFTAA
jgi:hypothetical protein